uniref:Uncharacterized protein n=1 Tax=Moniliophthora roreri TaxID=221103 RepID=A0A0W0EV19_MONRR
MTHKVKSKPATAVASSLKSKDVSLPQLSTVNVATLSILHLHCTMLFDTCHNIWKHLKGQSSLFTDMSALVNYAFPAMKIPLPLNSSASFPSKEDILAEYDPDQNIPNIDDNIKISDHEDSDSSEDDALGDKDMVEIKPSKHPAHIIKPPAHATPIVEVTACPSTSGKTKQKGAGDMDINELDPSQPSAVKSIQDLDLEEIISRVGQGHPAKENTLNVLCLLQALGQTKAVETANAGPSSATPHAASPTNTVDLTNKASAVVAGNTNLSVYFFFLILFHSLANQPPPNSIAFFSLPHLLTAPESDDKDEVLYTLPT